MNSDPRVCLVSWDGRAYAPPPARRNSRRRPARDRTPSMRAAFVSMRDRVEAAVQDGRIDLLDDDGPTPRLEITTGELGLLLHILMPDEYPAPRPRPRATPTAPGSAARVEAYAKRVAAGEDLWNPLDPEAVRDDRRALAGLLRGGRSAQGADLSVSGWAG